MQVFFKYWWSWYIFWIPTIQTDYQKKDKNVLCNYTVNNQKYKGYKIGIKIHLFIFTFYISFWFNVEKA